MAHETQHEGTKLMTLHKSCVLVATYEISMSYWNKYTALA